ncbi:PREDICTED: dual specificity protein phosphatase CDC14A-like [Ceratosolen solmsi marchali]|uniref:protein-tyrosine-phosphatase n=1 Tax=Ceratosolen solmsi marchali TaxID=326594 RepID=A0AAJ6YDI4_9HYME|nr:PREDICTED: dual specificity protein phosphatase CDC14A-like [Ceratosolen solmsi marchali]
MNLNNLDLSIYDNTDLMAIIEIIKNKFYFATLIPGRKEPKHIPNMYLFDIDGELIYNNFYSDFGPLNIACLYKYCYGVNQILNECNDLVVHYTCVNAEKRANAAYLVASYAVLYLNKSPEEIYNTIVTKDLPSLKPFQDASIGYSHHQIRLIDCLRALKKAALFGFFDFQDFDVKEYEKYVQMKNGDLNWIVPRKLLAFFGPNVENDSVAHYPEKYLNYFLKNDITTVIRLNKKTYNSFRFTNAGLFHYDLFFPDGGVPSKRILDHFLHIVETTRGAIAVHCKAGLGRTGTLIATYVMKHYKMTAREAIAWLRICRPGSVIGYQQLWLEEMEISLLRAGRRFRYKYYGDENFILHHERGIYSVAVKYDEKLEVRNYRRKKYARTLKKLSNMSDDKSSMILKSRYSFGQESVTSKATTANHRFQVQHNG